MNANYGAFQASQNLVNTQETTNEGNAEGAGHKWGTNRYKSFLVASIASVIICTSPNSSSASTLCPDSLNLSQTSPICLDSVYLSENSKTSPDSMNLIEIQSTSSLRDFPTSPSSPQTVTPALGPPELASHLEAQIWLDLESQMGASKEHEARNSVDLFELAQRLEEIDSTLPPDSSLLQYSPSQNRIGSGDYGDLVVTSFSPSFAISSFSAASGSVAADIAVAASAVAPAVASTTAGLGSRVSSILASGSRHLLGGGMAGAVGATLVYPLDTLKTKMQAQTRTRTKGKDEEGEKEGEYKNEFDCFVKMVKKDGVGSLYQGLGPQLVGVAPEKAVKLTVNEVILSILETVLPGARIWALELIAGGGGGFSQVVFTNPVEMVKVRLQTQPNDGTPPKNTLQVIKELGFKGLYMGSTVTMLRDVPGSAIFFAFYAFLKTVFPENYFLDGCLAAIPASIVVTPMDVVKTRLTMEPSPGVEPYKNGWDCVQRIVKEEGVGTLFKGCLSRVLRISPQFGITLMIYDYIS